MTRRGDGLRCPGCRLHPTLCYCALIKPFDTATQVVVIQREDEAKKPSNTGRLVGFALLNGDVRQLSTKAPQAVDLPGAERRLLVLFPTDDAAVLDRELVEADPRPITLIVPDGRWRQARRVLKRQPELAALPCVRVAAGPPSRYHLRRQPDPDRLATFEAVARALGVIEGVALQTSLEAVMDLMVERALRGRSGTDEGSSS